MQLLLFRKNHARLACSVVNALSTAHFRYQLLRIADRGKPCLACFASSPIFCPFCFAKDRLLSSSLSYLFCYTQRKGTKGKSLIPFLARKERLDRASPVLLASQALPFYVPFCYAKRWTIEFESLLFNFTLPQKKKHKDNSLCFFWRGRRDSNSRAGFPTYALSRGASSPT